MLAQVFISRGDLGLYFLEDFLLLYFLALLSYTVKCKEMEKNGKIVWGKWSNCQCPVGGNPQQCNESSHESCDDKEGCVASTTKNVISTGSKDFCKRGGEGRQRADTSPI